MYKHFFGLRENPFNTNPDPRFLFSTDQTDEALDQLVYGIQNRKGLILLTGEVGTGKTTLVNYLLDWLRKQKMPTAFIFNSHLSVNHLFDFILSDFGIPVDFKLKSNMLLHLNNWLLDRYSAGETPVLIIDEAQGLSLELLEEIRLLLNLETASEKLLQVILVGQPELEDHLKRPEMRQLRQRIVLRCTTTPLTLDACREYLSERLRIAGATGAPIFSPEAVRAVHFYSQGIPRVMNLLCEHALINAYVEQLNPVPPEMVEEAARDFLLDEFRPLPRDPHQNAQLNDTLTVMKSILTNQRTRPVIAAELTAMNSLAPQSQPVPPAAPLSLLDLTSPTSAPNPQPGHMPLPVDSITSRAESVLQLIYEMKNNLSLDYGAPKLHIMPPVVPHDHWPENKRFWAAPSSKRIPNLNSFNKLHPHNALRRLQCAFASLAAWSAPGSNLFLPAIYRSLSSHASASAIRNSPQFLRARYLLQLWRIEFIRDWHSLLNSFAFPRMKRALLSWLSQPLSSKHSPPQ
jgi:general secretion pathway protein A